MRYHTSLHKKLFPQVCCLYSHCWPRRCCSSGHYICCPVYLIEMRNALVKCYKIYYSVYVLKNFKRYYFLLSQNVILLPKMVISFIKYGYQMYMWLTVNFINYKSWFKQYINVKLLPRVRFNSHMQFFIIIFHNKLSQLTLTSFTAAISVCCLCSL